MNPFAIIAATIVLLALVLPPVLLLLRLWDKFLDQGAEQFNRELRDLLRDEDDDE
jgi:hypothetical protein